MSGFMQALRAAWARNDSLLCVGLDPEPDRFPQALAGDADAVFTFCRDIVDATADLVCAFKPQIAHFAARGAEGALERVIRHIHTHHPGVPVILDSKRGDIGSTARHYAAEAFDRYGADAVTVNPYLGRDSVEPFLQRADKGVILLCRTSNPGGADLQALPVAAPGGGTRKLYQHVAALVAGEWNTHGNCALVVGATWPDELAEVRQIVGNLPLLVPGVGAQGGDVGAVLASGATSAGDGLIISASRAVLYASEAGDFAQAARQAAAALRESINRHRARPS